MRSWLAALSALILLALTALAPNAGVAAERERINIDRDWRFAFGHATDPGQDFGYGTAAFFFAKAGYGDGPASVKFDDRAWRKLDLPHDWAVEKPFDPRANTNHGSRAVGAGFPQNNVGWYRKTIDIAKTDEGRRIALEFDGVYRDSVVWFNGHYIGQEHSGYSGFRYDLTDYVNYGGPNVLVVRVDASVEEGWFYEGAGIYRHVWLTKTAPLHVAQWGVFVTTRLGGGNAALDAKTTVDNEDDAARTFTIDQQVLDPEGREMATSRSAALTLAAGQAGEFPSALTLPKARLWSIQTPVLHRLVTTIRDARGVVDRYETTFGVRTVRFDPDTGFWLNGVNIKLKGVNNHQDHAGVGVALPDGLQSYRLQRLKAMGANAYRTSHHPPTPEMLDAADRLGMLVIDEHRMMGTTPEIKDQLRRMVVRDRNHPSVILWSVGNEEWALENNELGARLTQRMQDYVKTLDTSRPSTLAMSSGAGRGGSTVTDVMGFNYKSQHDIDAYHRAFPKTPSLMTEEGSTVATRGVYVTDRDQVHIAAYDAPQRPGSSSSIEQGWNFVVDRPFLAGMFVWTGFDYRGETTPFGWPAISSQFGMLDTTGRFKDSAYYLQSWWSDAPMVHILPHWNWPDRLGQTIPVWVYSNSQEVELFLDDQSLGRKAMPRGGHLEWPVVYRPGVLSARGYGADGRQVAIDTVATTGPPASVHLKVESAAAPTGDDLAIVTVSVVDAKGRLVPTSGDDIEFRIAGPVRILGVGNGDPGSHEADQYVDDVVALPTSGWALADLTTATIAPDLKGAQWRDPFQWHPPGEGPPPAAAFGLRGRFDLTETDGAARRVLYLPALADRQKVLVNDVDITSRLRTDDRGYAADLSGVSLRPGANTVLIMVSSDGEVALRKLIDGGIGGRNVAFVQVTRSAGPWKRRVFNGYAQIVVQSTGEAGPATLTAMGSGLRPATLTLPNARPAYSPLHP